MHATPSNAFRADPFSLMLEPQRVLQAVAHSERLARLRTRIYRPLDKPLIPKKIDAAAEYDRRVDAGLDTDA